MTLQLDGRRSSSPAVSFDDDATVVADMFRVPVEAFGPSSEIPTVLAKANPVLEFALPLDEPGIERPETARARAPSSAAITRARRRLNAVVAGIWAATFVVLSLLVYLVTTAKPR